MLVDPIQVTEADKFVIELEFVQCLANPAYLACTAPPSYAQLCKVLAQQGYFDDAKFVAYLQYLLYLRHPKYTVFLTYLLAPV